MKHLKLLHATSENANRNIALVVALAVLDVDDRLLGERLSEHHHLLAGVDADGEHERRGASPPHHHTSSGERA